MNGEPSLFSVGDLFPAAPASRRPLTIPFTQRTHEHKQTYTSRWIIDNRAPRIVPTPKPPSPGSFLNLTH